MRKGSPSCTKGPFSQRFSSWVNRSTTPAKRASEGSNPTVKNCLSPVWTSRARREGSTGQRGWIQVGRVGSIREPEAGKWRWNGEDLGVELLTLTPLLGGTGFDQPEILPALGDDVAL